VGYPPPVQLVVRGPLHRWDLDGLSQRVCAVLSGLPGRVVHCHLTNIEADAVAVDALARLQLVARREGCLVVLCDVTPELRELVNLLGLVDVLPERL